MVEPVAFDCRNFFILFLMTFATVSIMHFVSSSGFFVVINCEKYRNFISQWYHWWLIIQSAMFLKHTTFILPDTSEKNIFSLYFSYNFCFILLIPYHWTLLPFLTRNTREWRDDFISNQSRVRLKTVWILGHSRRPRLPSSLCVLRKNWEWHWAWYTGSLATRSVQKDSCFRTFATKLPFRSSHLFRILWINWTDSSFFLTQRDSWYQFLCSLSSMMTFLLQKKQWVFH